MCECVCVCMCVCVCVCVCIRGEWSTTRDGQDIDTNLFPIAVGHPRLPHLASPPLFRSGLVTCPRRQGDNLPLEHVQSPPWHQFLTSNHSHGTISHFMASKVVFMCIISFPLYGICYDRMLMSPPNSWFEVSTSYSKVLEMGLWEVIRS